MEEEWTDQLSHDILEIGLIPIHSLDVVHENAAVLHCRLDGCNDLNAALDTDISRGVKVSQIKDPKFIVCRRLTRTDEGIVFESHGEIVTKESLEEVSPENRKLAEWMGILP